MEETIESIQKMHVGQSLTEGDLANLKLLVEGFRNYQAKYQKLLKEDTIRLAKENGYDSIRL